MPLKTYPNLWMRKWLGWMLIKRIKRFRPLYHLDYQKQEAKKFLRDEFGWQWYGGHHLENKYTIFVSNYLQPRKFGIDLRYIEFSALVRSRQMTRRDALRKIEEPPKIDSAILDEVKKRLNLTNEDFEKIMQAPKKTHHDYETYHSLFKRFKWFFWVLHKTKRIPTTFYVKYTI